MAYEPYSGELGEGYLVEKSIHEKMKDFHLRALGTPVTIVGDAVGTVLVVGVYLSVVDPEGTHKLLQAIADDESAPLNERLKAVQVMGDFSDVKPKGGMNVDDVGDRLRLTLHLIRQEVPEKIAEGLIERLSGVWK